MDANPTLVLASIAVVVVVCLGMLIVLSSKVHRNRRQFLALEAHLGMPRYTPPTPHRRGLVAVLAGQWWAYMPMLALAALAYWRVGPSFEMWVMLGGAAFWITTSAAEDTNSP